MSELIRKGQVIRVLQVTEGTRDKVNHLKALYLLKRSERITTNKLIDLLVSDHLYELQDE